MEDACCRALYKGYWRKKAVTVYAEETPVEVKIQTLEGEMTASPGDMIITGVNGEKYPCKPDIFFKTYQFASEADHFDFGTALQIMKSGKKIARSGWNGKGQYIELATNISYKNSINEIVNVDHATMGNRAIAFVGTSGVQLGWLASQADMLSEDWMIVE